MNKLLMVLLSIVVVSSCQTMKKSNNSDTDKDYSGNISTVKSVVIPKDANSTPLTGENPIINPDTVLTISQIGQEFEVRHGQEINIIYEASINPEATYFTYESTFDGYTLTLRERNEHIEIVFERMCQIFIVANPNLTYVSVPDNLKYEQLIWTPRLDGTWEVRIGTTERGCKSNSLNDLKKLRTQEYEQSIPK